MVVCVPQTTPKLFSQRTAKKCTKIYNARAQLLFCSLNLLFGNVLVAVVGAVCLSSPIDAVFPRFLLITHIQKPRFLNYVQCLLVLNNFNNVFFTDIKSEYAILQ